MMYQLFCTCIVLQKGKPTRCCCLSSQKLWENTEPPSWKEVSGERKGETCKNEREQSVDTSSSKLMSILLYPVVVLHCVPLAFHRHYTEPTCWEEQCCLMGALHTQWGWISQATFELQCFLKLDPFLLQSPEWIPAPLYWAYCRGMHAMEAGCPVQYFSLLGPELCSCSHPAGSDFFVVFFWHCFLTVLLRAWAVSSFWITCLFIEVIGVFCLRQLSEITQIKVTIRFFFSCFKVKETN